MMEKITKISIYLLVFFLPLFFLTASFEPFEFNKTYLILLLVPIGFLAYLAHMIFEEKRIRYLSSPLDVFVLGFLVVMILNAIFSIDKTATLYGFYGRFWPNLFGVIALAVFYFLITNNVAVKNNEKSKKLIPISSLVKLFIWSSFVATLVAYLSLFNVWPKLVSSLKLPAIMSLKTFNTVGGSFEALSVFLAAVLVLLVTLSTFKSSKESEENEEGLYRLQFPKFFLYLLMIMIFVFLAIVDFWAAWLMVAVSLILFVGFAFWKRVFKEDVNRLSVSILFLIFSLVFIFGDPLRGLLSDIKIFRFLPVEVQLPQKTSWQVAVGGLKENPVLGVGEGNFSYIFNKYKPESFLKESRFWQIRFDRAGDFMAEMLGTTGIFGILALLALIGMFVLVSVLVLSSFSDIKPLSVQVPLILTLMALVAGMFVYTQNSTLAFSFFFFLALSCLSWDKPQKEKVIEFKQLPELGLVITMFFWALLLGVAFFYFTMARYYVADVYYKQFLVNPLKNIDKMEEAVNLNGRRSEYHAALARGYLLKISEELAKKKPDNNMVIRLVAASIREGRMATQVSPKSVIAREALGSIYRQVQGLAQGALEWGIKTYQTALESDPKNPVLITELGRLMRADNKSKEARDLFNKALKLKPGYVPAEIELALLDESEKKIDEAIKRLEETVKTNPFSVDARFQLGRLYYNNKQYNKAETELVNTLLLFPNHWNARYVLALVYEKKGQKDKAIQLYESILKGLGENKAIRDKIAQLKGEKVESSEGVSTKKETSNEEEGAKEKGSSEKEQKQQESQEENSTSTANE